MTQRFLFISVLVVTRLMAQTAGQDKSIFAGLVQDSVTTQPILKATVSLVPHKSGQHGYSTTTDATGSFRFEAVDPGDYHTRVTRRGYSDADDYTAIVPIAAGQNLTGVAIKLDPEAFVTGRVIDSDGEPVPGANVTAFAPAWQQGSRIYEPASGAEADDRGEYRLKLSKGGFNLVARVRSHSTGTGGTFTAESGGPEMKIGEAGVALDVSPGQEIRGIDFKLSVVPAFHVRGVVKPFPPTSQQTFLVMRRQNGDGSNPSNPEGEIKSDGSFNLDGVEAGDYVMELWPPGLRPTGRLAVAVSDRDLNNLEIPARWPFELKGHLRLEDGNPPPGPTKVGVHLLDFYEFRVIQSASSATDGEFQLTGLASGEYVIDLPTGRDLYLKSATYAQQEVDHGRIDLMNGASGELEIVLGSGTGQVEGKLRQPDPSPGITGILVSADGRTGNTGLRSAKIEDGQFQFHFVPPGRHFLFAVQSFNADLWQNMDFVQQIASKGVTVDLAKSGDVQAADVPILTPDDLQQAIARAKK